MATMMIRIRLGAAGQAQIGPGKVRLLELVGQHGSISAAGRAMGMSYRRAWLLLDEINRTFREPSVQAQAGGPGGGGAVLTPFGERLVATFRTIERSAAAAADGSLAALEADLKVDGI